jgi:hypothetical protein
VDHLHSIKFPDGVADEVWSGHLPEPTETWDELNSNPQTWIRTRKYDLSWNDLIQRLTFGAIGNVLDIYIPPQGSDLWRPRVLVNLGFVTSDRMHRRFFRYLELSQHVELESWNTRAMWMRTNMDVRRAFARTYSTMGWPGGYIDFDSAHFPPTEPFYDRLATLSTVIK